ncbi:alpha/beta fold hydrolase [Amnibacterium endophyticum]|uniref:Alpha/beta fold hydrolase n=1 Tax=Amnibacterium endophyticum TaxID=2109337 RepID=A0ABW4LJV6_9MICO
MASPSTTGSVRSADGTAIGYLRRGNGPGVVLVQGAMADARAYDRFAELLSGSFTVFSADRRGRASSPRPYGQDHDLARDVEDIDAILRTTGTSTVFGLSSGAVITLEAAKTLPRIERAVVFEPPFYDHGIDRAGIARLGQEIERGDLPSALLDALLTAGTAPAPLRRLPRPIARLLTGALLALHVRTSGSATSLRDLLPGVRYDFHDVSQANEHPERYQDLEKPLLVISGTKSPAFLQHAARTLAARNPRAELVELPGLGHDGPWNSGRPGPVAEATLRFLTQDQPHR